MSRFCASCGTEVDDTAVFCPTCGQPIDASSEAEIPAAPAWPEPAEPAEPPTRVQQPVPREEPWPEPGPEPAAEPDREPERWTDAPPAERWSDTAPAPPPPAPTIDDAPADRRAASASPPPPSPPPSQVELPFTAPVMLSGWLIGGGALLGALGALIGLFGGLVNPIDLLFLIALLGIAASVFLVDRVPAMPHLRLATFAIVLIAFGVALDRIATGRAGAGELLLFLGTAAAAIGAILLELGSDQPVGGPSS